jgi:hypothetical protein
MKLALALLVALLILTGCSTDREYARSICILVDVSDTYTDQKTEVVDLVKKGILPGMLPGDTILVIRIDSESYEKDNVEAMMTLDTRPSLANAQKLAFAKKLNAFAAREDHASYTDIDGALMLAADYLRETGAGTQVIVAFSDMKEDLPPGLHRTLEESEFNDIRVVAANVKKLQRDNMDPAAYRERLDLWEKRVLECGALEWRVILDNAKLFEYLDDRV